MKKYIVILMFFAIALQACKDVVSQHLSFDDVDYVSDFPKSIELERVSPVDIDLMGCVDFFGNDSLLIFKMMGLDHHWKVCSINQLGKCVDLLKKGQGPNEFVNMPSNEYFHNGNNDCKVWLSTENRICQIDISQSLQTGKTVLDTLFRVPVNETAVNCVAIDDSSYFVSLYKYNSFKRCLLIRDKLHDLPQLDVINKPTVYNDLNSLSAVRRYEASQKKIVEGMLHLNQINLYSLEDDSTFTKTICLGDHLTDLGVLDSSSKNGWKKYYGAIVTHPNYFAAMYYNTSRSDFFSGKMKKVDIQFFNWEGKPLLNIVVPYSVETFFIHKNRDLYLLSANGEEERLYKYTLGDLLQNL